MEAISWYSSENIIKEWAIIMVTIGIYHKSEAIRNIVIIKVNLYFEINNYWEFKK